MDINGELYFNITIGDYTNFLKYDDLILFRMLEHSGAAGVEITMSFRTDNPEIKDLVIANNQIKIDVGKSETDCKTYTVYPYEIEPNNDTSDSQYVITFTATPLLKFITEKSSESFTGTSIQVIDQIAKKYFGKGVQTDLIPFEDSHTWLRGFKTGAQYMTNAWLHMYLGNKGCPVLYIDKDCQVYVYDIDDIKKKEAKWKFVPRAPQSGENNTYQYLNSFSINSYKYFTNEFTGFGDITTITNTQTGKDEIVIPENVPDLAATSEVEKAIIQYTRYSENIYQSDNNHANYQKAYKNNVARLVKLNSIEGELQVAGFHPEINVLDKVNVDDGMSIDSGNYLVDTKMFELSYNSPILTTIAVCRDNRNRIEDLDVFRKKNKGLFQTIIDIINAELPSTLQAIRNLRRVVVMGRQILSGWFLVQVIKHLNSFKYNLLTSFSLFGTTLNFNSAVALMESLKAAGNSFCNQIVNAYIPYPFSYVLRNFATERPSLRTMLSKLLYTFSPTNEIAALITEISGLMADLTGSASKIYDSSVKAISMSEYASSGYSTGTLTSVDGKDITLPNSKGEDMALVEDQKRIQEITTEFIEHTEGADIPIPQISLTESESLLPKDELRDLMADRTIESLVQQGYLYGIENFKNILLGVDYMDFNTINQINKNIGNMMYARYWGAFKNPEEITDFFVQNAYKDIYVTVPTTKIISAVKGSKVFMALPMLEEDITFYINNKEVEMDVIDKLDLGLYTISGYPLLYNVYMSQEQFNSNSVVLEVRKKRVVK